LGRVGVGQWRIVTVEDELAPAVAPVRKLPPAATRARNRAPNPGLLLLAGAAIWALWFFWSLIGED
jgi:hypothetical protein